MLAEPKLIDQIWPQLWKALKKSVEDFGIETEQELHARLLRADGYIVIVGDAVAVVRNCGRFFEINYIGGKNIKKYWPKLSEHFDLMAKAFGCQKIISFGRDAWEKIATDFKKQKIRMYVKEVENA